MPGAFFKTVLFLTLPLLFCTARVAVAQTEIARTTSNASDRSSETEMSDIRRSYLELRRDAVLATSPPLVPSNKEFAVYVSVDPTAKVTLEAASLAVNDELACNDRYTPEQLAALRRNAANRLCVGKLAPGTTSLTITLSGMLNNGKPWRQSASVAFTESSAPRYVEFRLARTSTKGIPDILAQTSS